MKNSSAGATELEADDGKALEAVGRCDDHKTHRGEGEASERAEDSRQDDCAAAGAARTAALQQRSEEETSTEAQTTDEKDTRPLDDLIGRWKSRMI
eukprot:scaffold2957_cov234-Pinguiococcus_pyrenoidosus.AAC.2